jgi:ferredoxin
MGPAIGHTMITTIVGPLIFGRILCGWGCWRAMVLERLPVGKGDCILCQRCGESCPTGR